MKFVAACLLVAFLSESAYGVPLKAKEDVEPEKSDPCNLGEFKNVTVCDAKDDKCQESRKKRQTLCKANPGCDFCGTPIDDDLESDININVADVIKASFEDDEEEAEAPKKLIERNIIIENDNDTQYYRGYVESGANITTIIRLVNHINNTNIIGLFSLFFSNLLTSTNNNEFYFKTCQ